MTHIGELCFFAFATFERESEEMLFGNWCHDIHGICRECKIGGRRAGMFYESCGNITNLRLQELEDVGEERSPDWIIVDDRYRLIEEFNFDQEGMSEMARGCK